MKIRQYIELAVNGCDCRECLDAIILTAEEEIAAELATLRAEVDAKTENLNRWRSISEKEIDDNDRLRAENERLREALRQLVSNAEITKSMIIDRDGFVSSAFWDTILQAKEALK